jgi:hypothetical protein
MRINEANNSLGHFRAINPHVTREIVGMLRKYPQQLIRHLMSMAARAKLEQWHRCLVFASLPGRSEQRLYLR